MRTYEPRSGEDIQSAVTTAIDMAREHAEEVQFTFNGVELKVSPIDSVEKVVSHWNREMDQRAEAYRNSPEGQAAEIARAVRQELAASAESEGILPFTITDQEGWDKTVAANTDGYGACAIRYAARWANVMERRIAAGETLEACADSASHEADVEGITGFMYGCAVGILAKCWARGEALRRWHNRETQAGDEGDKANESGGVLNPAMLSIG